MRALALFACVLAALVCASDATVYDENPCTSVTSPDAFFDPRFSNNSCVVIGRFEEPNCALVPPARNETQVDDGCPGYPDDDDQGELLPTGQYLFENLVDAIENCPFTDPTLIEFTGTQYLWDGTGIFEGFFYNKTSDLVLRGVPYERQVGGEPFIVLTPTNVTYSGTYAPVYNATLNVTTCEPTGTGSEGAPPSTLLPNNTCDPSAYSYTVTELVETTEYTPLVNISQAPTTVGFQELQVRADNVSVTMEDIIFEGCGTEASVFLTEFCPRECVLPDELDICAGAYFRQEDADLILNNGTCMRTGAYFDGARALVSDFNDTAWVRAFQEEATIELWVRPDEDAFIGRQSGLTTVHYAHDDDDDDSHGFGLVWANEEDEDGNPEVLFAVGANDKFGRRLRGPVPRGQWTHVAGTWNRGEQRLYINGELADSKIRSQQDIDYQSNRYYGVAIGRAFCEGCDPKQRYFNGTLDEVRLWSEERTQAQIQALRYQPLGALSNYPRLEGYWRFDLPHDGEADLFTRNLVAVDRGRPDLDTVVEYRTVGGQLGGPRGLEDPYPIPNCFCERPSGLCTATDLYLEFPYEAVLTDYGDTCLQGENCTFLHGMLIDPNGGSYVARGFGTSGPFQGKIWLPGVRQFSGPIFDEVMRFIPGRFESVPITYTEFNATLNATVTIVNGTETAFVPGAVASELPPASEDYGHNLWQEEGFVPGWFINNGWPPFRASNFIPGQFFPPDVANATYSMPLPLDWEEGDLVFVPGHFDEAGNQTGDLLTLFFDLVNRLTITLIGGVAFNPDIDIDPCVIPASPDVILGTANDTVSLIPLEDEFGCEIVEDPLFPPEYLDPAQRDVCAQLAEIRATLPAGTESLAAEDVLGCGPIADPDFAPAYLSESRKDRCAILRELREQVAGEDTFALECARAGGVVQEAHYMPCLRNQNLTLSGVVFQNYYGDDVVCQHACDDYVVSVVQYSQFINTPGTALSVIGMQSYDLHDSNFCPAGGQTPHAVYLNMHHASRGVSAWYNNRYCFQEDTMPVDCRYPISATVRCEEGELYCVDLVATQGNNCPLRPITDTLYEFDDDCAVFAPCAFPQTTVNVTLGDGSISQLNTTSGDIDIEIAFLTPIIAELTDGESRLLFECQPENQTQSVTYPCLITETIEVVTINTTEVFNATLNATVTVNITTIEYVEIQYPGNCTDTFQIEGCASFDFTCPCPPGFSSNFTSNATGSAALGSQDCEYALPGYEATGETCLDTTVQCLYEGGTLGTGEPPPVPVGECDPDTGQALVVCDATTCLGGQLYYEGVYHACDLAGNCNVNTTGGYLNVPCMCDSTSTGAGFLEFTDCDRTTCIGTPCVVNATLPYNGTLCEVLDGQYTWDGANYDCYLAENSTVCAGASYVPSYTPSPPPDGTIVIPCSNNYVPPAPGPCTCVATELVAGNSSIAGNGTETNTQISFVGDPALQLVCRIDGTIACRCDGALARNTTTLPSNRTIYPGFAAFHIDNVNVDQSLWFSGANTAVGADVGVKLERFGGDIWGGWDLTRRFALKWPHFFTGHSLMYEMRRVNPFISGTVHDWQDGHDDQWNMRYCSLPFGFPVNADPCYQYRPRAEVDACVVNKDLYTEASPNFGVTQFDRIQEAIDECGFNAIIIEQANAFYEERFSVQKKNMWIGSYTDAVLVGSNIRTAADNITLRGIIFNSPNTNDFPIIIPAAPGEDFDKIQDRIASGKQDTRYKNLRILNCEFNGNNVISSGAVVGVLDDEFEFRFNSVNNFKGVAIDVSARNDTLVQLNRFFENQGRSLRIRAVRAYQIDENYFIQCVGVRAGKDTEICSVEAYVDKDDLPALKGPEAFARLLQRQLDLDDGVDDEAFIAAYLPQAPSPDTVYGCNIALGLDCYIRGNIQAVSDDAVDRSTVVFNVKYGGIMPEEIHDNVATHGQIGMLFDQTFAISYGDRDRLFRNNALVRVQQTRKRRDVSFDLGFRPTGLKDVVGCYFPGCAFANTTFPEIQVNPRHALNLVPEYGFRYLQNITECSIYSLALNLCKVTSGQARLRREFMYLQRDIYAEGVLDFPCCQKPVVYGNHEFAGAETNVFDTIEWRYFFELGDFEIGHELFRTSTEFQLYQLYFENCCFDGNYYLYEENSRIMDIYVREDIGEFVLTNNRFYNWWHYPDGTELGFVLDDAQRGEVPVVILPNGDVFKWDRSPTMSGIHVSFRPYTVFDQNPFVIPREDPNLGRGTYDLFAEQLGGEEEADTLIDDLYDRNIKPPKRVIYDDDRSYLIGEENYWRDLDGLALRAQAPANILWLNNTVHDCGMRQYEAISAWDFELNPSSFGEYVWEYNYLNQTKPYLFPLGGGDMSVRFAAIRIYQAGRPRRFRIFNTTVVLLEDQPLEGIFAGLTGTDTTEDPFQLTPGPPKMDPGPVGTLATTLFGPTDNPITTLNTATNDDIPTFDGELRDYTGTRFQPVITSDGFLDPTSNEQRRYGFATSEDSRQLSRNIGQLLWVTGVANYDVRFTDRGFWVAIALAAIDADTLYKNVVPGRQNTTLLPFLQPELSPLRAIAGAQNSQDTIYMLSQGMSFDDLPRNGPGAHGCVADITYCPAYQESAANYFNFCAVCNDGCPPRLPDYCVVDPYDGLAVPENPFYNTWMFDSINQAVLTCVAPSRLIKINAQPDHRPYDEALDLRGPGNYTLFSDTGAVLRVDQHPMYINANYLSFRNLTFEHRLGNGYPTVASGAVIEAAQPAGPVGTAFEDCTFDGRGKKASAVVSGRFEEFALFNSLVFNYKQTPSAIQMNCSCGVFLAEGNLFEKIDGAAINVTDVDVARIERNAFDDCGGRYEGSGAVVYVRPCIDSMVQLYVYRNWQLQTRDVKYPRTPDGQYVAAYWVDGVSNRTYVVQEPRYETLDNGTVVVAALFNTTKSVEYELSKNEAAGLPVGFRLTRYQPQPSLFNPPTSLSAGPRFIYAIHPNTDLEFGWHCVTVYTDELAANTSVAQVDAYVDGNPAASVNYWCDCNDACSTGAAGALEVYFWASFIGFFLFISLLIGLCCVRVPWRGWVFINGSYFHVSSGEDRSREVQTRNLAGENRLSVVNPGNVTQPGRHPGTAQYGVERRLYSDR